MIENRDIERKIVEDVCRKYGYKYHETAAGFFIRTISMSGWRIDMERDEFILYHENYRKRKQNHQKLHQTYHKQDVKNLKTLDEILKYIHLHDKGMLKMKTINNI